MSGRLVTVFGATGRQGGGVARALLADPQRRFRVRAVTRRTTSLRARALARAGAELCTADSDDPPSLAAALAGAHGAFCAAPWSGPDAGDRATDRAYAMVRAAARSNVAHVVWSTLQDTRGEAIRAFREFRVPTTLFYGSPHWEDVLSLGLRECGDGTLVLGLPLGTASLPGIAGADEGACVAALFAIGEEAIGRSVGVASEHLTGPRMAEHIALALRIRVSHQPGEPADPDVARAYRFMRDCAPSFCAVRSVACTRELHPRVLGFAAWLASVRGRLPHPLREAAQ